MDSALFAGEVLCVGLLEVTEGILVGCRGVRMLGCDLSLKSLLIFSFWAV